MVVDIVKKVFVASLLLLFTGCYSTQQVVKDVFQSESATTIEYDYLKIQKLLKTLKTKIDARNPKAYNKDISKRINTLIDSSQKDFLLKYNDVILDDYKDYLQLAFSKDYVSNRNDYLMLGLYYLVHQAYEADRDYKLLAFQYSTEKLQKLYKNLQLIRWKIKTDRDLDGNYLFLTWQNNWQIELEKKYKDKFFTSDDIKNLEYIKNQKESIYSHSNFSFEVLLTQMIDSTGNSLRALGEEPRDLSISAIKMFIFL